MYQSSIYTIHIFYCSYMINDILFLRWINYCFHLRHFVFIFEWKNKFIQLHHSLRLVCASVLRENFRLIKNRFFYLKVIFEVIYPFVFCFFFLSYPSTRSTQSLSKCHGDVIFVFFFFSYRVLVILAVKLLSRSRWPPVFLTPPSGRFFSVYYDLALECEQSTILFVVLRLVPLRCK